MTPKAPGAPDLAITIQGPATVAAGDRIQYRVTVRNDGLAAAGSGPMVVRLRGNFEIRESSLKRWSQGAIIYGGISREAETEFAPVSSNESALVTVQYAPASGQKKSVVFTVFAHDDVTRGLAVEASVDPVKGEVIKENNKAAFFSKAAPGPDLTVHAITPGGPIDRLRIKPGEKIALTFEVENQGAGPADDVMVQLIIPVMTIVDVRVTPEFVNDIKKEQGNLTNVYGESMGYIVRSTVTFNGGRLEAGQKTAFIVDVQAPATPFGRSLAFEGRVSASKSTPEINTANNSKTIKALVR